MAKQGKATSSNQKAPIAPFTKRPAPTTAQPVLRFTPSYTTPSPFVSEPTRTSGASSRNYYGIEAGITAATLTGGSLTLDFPYPYDNIGSGQTQYVGPVDDHNLNIRYAVGGVLDLAMTDMISVQGKLGYRVLGSSGTDARKFYCFAVATQRGDTATFNDEYSLNVGTISLDLLGRFHFMRDGLYGLAGVGVGRVISATASASQRITSPNQCQYTYSSSPNALTGSFISENTDIDLSDVVSSTRFDLRAGIGTFIPIGDDGMVLAPELTVGIPLSSFLADTTKQNRDFLSHPYASFTIALKIPWGNPVSSGQSQEIEMVEATSQSTGQTVEATESGKVDLTGRVLNQSNEVIEDASITVVDLNTNEVVATEKTQNGEYSVEVDAPGRYSVTADAQGYLFGSTYYELDSEGRILRNSGDIRLSRSSDGRVRLLIFFDFDKAILQPASYPELDRAVALMKSNPTMEVEIAGYTDAQGADAYNKDLSQRRANSVLDYLVQKGIEKTRISATGYGEANPVSTNDTDSGRAENRRVEFVVKRR